jgi:hypothetical protein
VKGFPFIGYGQDPWRPTSTGAGLPRQVGEIKTLSVDYRLGLEAQGKYNLAFDIWITSGLGVSAPPEANITREVMIWLDTSPGAQAAPLIEETSIDGELYTFHKAAGVSDAGYTRDYLAFVKSEAKYDGTTNLEAILRYLVDNGHITSDEYVRNVFLGNEVWAGTGQLLLDEFSITAN